jgi:hypothetical protein
MKQTFVPMSDGSRLSMFTSASALTCCIQQSSQDATMKLSITLQQLPRGVVLDSVLSGSGYVALTEVVKHSL